MVLANTSKGINKYDGKDRRAVRRSNHIARDLAKSKYHQRIVERKFIHDEDTNTSYVDERTYDDSEG